MIRLVLLGVTCVALTACNPAPRTVAPYDAAPAPTGTCTEGFGALQGGTRICVGYGG